MFGECLFPPLYGVWLFSFTQVPHANITSREYMHLVNIYQAVNISHLLRILRLATYIASCDCVAFRGSELNDTKVTLSVVRSGPAIPRVPCLLLETIPVVGRLVIRAILPPLAFDGILHAGTIRDCLVPAVPMRMPFIEWFLTLGCHSGSLIPHCWRQACTHSRCLCSFLLQSVSCLWHLRWMRFLRLFVYQL